MHELIKHNAQLIRDLQDRVHQTFSEKPHGPEHKLACEEFQSRYDSLAFPGGYEVGLKKISQGDASTLDTALNFLELQPYFFRSQYMRTKLIRLLKKAHLTEPQQTRFNNVLRR